jgi:hypothetical protein
MAERLPTAKNLSVLMRSLSAQPRQTWLWLAPYVAIGVFALAMLVVTGLLQWRELDTAKSALEGDMHWAERTIENRLQAHQDFLGELGRDQEFKQLTYESFQVRAGRYVREAPEIIAIVWVDIDGKVEWVAPNDRPSPSSATNSPAPAWPPCRKRCVSGALSFRRTIATQRSVRCTTSFSRSSAGGPTSAPSSPCSRWRPCCVPRCQPPSRHATA